MADKIMVDPALLEDMSGKFKEIAKKLEDRTEDAKKTVDNLGTSGFWSGDAFDNLVEEMAQAQPKLQKCYTGIDKYGDYLHIAAEKWSTEEGNIRNDIEEVVG